MSKKIKADMGKLEEIQTILENNAKKITHNITRIGELHKEIDVSCTNSNMRRSNCSSHISSDGRYAVFLDPYNGSRERQ